MNKFCLQNYIIFKCQKSRGTSRISKRHTLFESASTHSTSGDTYILWKSSAWHVTRSDVTSGVGMTFEIEERERTRVRPRKIGSLSMQERQASVSTDAVDVDVAAASRSAGLAPLRRHKAMFATARSFHCC